ncbi:levansucrase [Pontibacillus halophilus JSM 076056 = DSM 19796]|uniref:Levansucrase n=2 Tax=Pontibacillus TaxID=289201 RepID=A0A0A5GDJ8_9BACI|nr:glycoside hydrolase family 68 protein [Pontibacillus halophilus]KGX89288.1 levansucrase [Pontibacillus halophilus JSM 076056 = DSM 19796]
MPHHDRYDDCSCGKCDYCHHKGNRKFRCCFEESGGFDRTPAIWTREQAEQIRITPQNAAPVIDFDALEPTAPDLWVWDTWPLREQDGSIAVLPGGWRVIFSLTAPRSVLPGKRHDIATIRYFYARDGQDWIPGGRVFPQEDPFGSRQWAGSAFVKDGEIFFFYTATGRRGETSVTYEQRLAFARGDVFSDLEGVLFDNWEEHVIIAEPDGEFYQTQEQSGGGIIYSFRDPWYYLDPESGCEFVLFEGNTAITPAVRECEPQNIGDGDFRSGNDVPNGAAQFNGNVGIMLLRNSDYTEWELLPAILEAECVNQQLERPHIVYSGGRYHLFIISHQFTFAPGLDGPDGLYGFVANNLFGNYVPLGEGGLVIANPPEQPFQAYSWLVLPDLSAESFVNYFNLEGLSLNEVGNQPDQYIFNHFGGVLAPTLQLTVDNLDTTIVNELAQGLVMESETQSAPFPPTCEKRRHYGDLEDEDRDDHAHTRGKRSRDDHRINRGGRRKRHRHD